MANFELFMGCLGNGLTVRNQSVIEYGDFQYIAHISPAGNIKWYIPCTDIPGEALLRIEHEADALYHNFKDALERDIQANPARAYFRMLDALTTDQMRSFIESTFGEPDESKIEKLKALYLKLA